jgi:mono/diheme cytochrome c family protein
MDLKRAVKLVVLGGVGLFALIQAVPYGRTHGNPPVVRAAKWPAGSGEQLAQQSCYDCHSNLTKWRWYSNIAPVSWLVQHDVDDGRGTLNFSDWNRGQPGLADLIEKVSNGEMPPTQYTLIHPSASLSSSERSQLEQALTRLYAHDPPPAGVLAG